jgi:hypothetical protein
LITLVLDQLTLLRFELRAKAAEAKTTAAQQGCSIDRNSEKRSFGDDVLSAYAADGAREVVVA